MSALACVSFRILFGRAEPGARAKTKKQKKAERRGSQKRKFRQKPMKTFTMQAMSAFSLVKMIMLYYLREREKAATCNFHWPLLKRVFMFAIFNQLPLF